MGNENDLRALRLNASHRCGNEDGTGASGACWNIWIDFKTQWVWRQKLFAPEEQRGVVDIYLKSENDLFFNALGWNCLGIWKNDSLNHIVKGNWVILAIIKNKNNYKTDYICSIVQPYVPYFLNHLKHCRLENSPRWSMIALLPYSTRVQLNKKPKNRSWKERIQDSYLCSRADQPAVWC